ncbi:MAG: hypothetical protein AAF437_07750 [Pseudomonadota bacterium]
MPVALFFPLLLRLAGPIAFLVAVAIAGAMNRSFILVPVLALAATLTTILIRTVTPSPAMDLKSVLRPEAEQRPHNPLRGSGKRFAAGLVSYAIIFALAALVAALFHTTEFEPQVMLVDGWFAIVPAIMAFVGAWVSARIGLNQMAGMMDQMQDAFAQMQTGQTPDETDAEAFTVEGEILDPERDDS